MANDGFQLVETDISTAFKRMWYRDDGTLRVEFHNRKPGCLGAVYEYRSVPSSVIESFQAAIDGQSVGSLFMREIVKKPDLYPFEKTREAE